MYLIVIPGFHTSVCPGGPQDIFLGLTWNKRPFPMWSRVMRVSTWKTHTWYKSSSLRGGGRRGARRDWHGCVFKQFSTTKHLLVKEWSGSNSGGCRTPPGESTWGEALSAPKQIAWLQAMNYPLGGWQRCCCWCCWWWWWLWGLSNHSHRIHSQSGQDL